MLAVYLHCRPDRMCHAQSCIRGQYPPCIRQSSDCLGHCAGSAANMNSEMEDRLGSHAQASHSHRSATAAPTQHQTAQPPVYNDATSDSTPHDQNGGASVTSGPDMLTTSRLAHASAHGVGQEAGPLPMLASACPGWVCYAEKTHGSYILPYISTTKSPQVSDMGSHLQTLCFNH